MTTMTMTTSGTSTSNRDIIRPLVNDDTYSDFDVQIGWGADDDDDDDTPEDDWDDDLDIYIPPNQPGENDNYVMFPIGCEEEELDSDAVMSVQEDNDIELDDKDLIHFIGWEDTDD